MLSICRIGDCMYNINDSDNKQSMDTENDDEKNIIENTEKENE